MKGAARMGPWLLAISGGLGALVLAHAPGCGGQVIEVPATDSATNAATNALVNMPLANLATNVPVNTANFATNLFVNDPVNVATNVSVNRPTNVATNVLVNAPANVATNVSVNQPTNVATNAFIEANVPIVGGDYIDAGVIHGYCFGLMIVGGVETIFDVESQLCCPYSLPGTSWEDIAMIGCNVNQPVSGATAGTWTPANTGGICVRGTGFQRIQIQGPNGATDANDRWCAAVPTTGGCVPWPEFNTACWDNSGRYYAFEPLEMVAALQPSLSDGVDVAVTPISGELCIRSLYIDD